MHDNISDLLTRMPCIHNTKQPCGTAVSILHTSMHRPTPCTHTHTHAHAHAQRHAHARTHTHTHIHTHTHTHTNTRSRHTQPCRQGAASEGAAIAKQAAAGQPAVRCERRTASATPSPPCIPPSPPSFRLVLSVSLPSFSVAGTARPERTAAYALPAPRACVRRV
jgi:hypothetical protein